MRVITFIEDLVLAFLFGALFALTLNLCRRAETLGV